MASCLALSVLALLSVEGDGVVFGLMVVRQEGLDTHSVECGSFPDLDHPECSVPQNPDGMVESFRFHHRIPLQWSSGPSRDPACVINIGLVVTKPAPPCDNGVAQ